ncbi:aldo/keto reductase [Pseudogemmobacter bohemicus]|uniref:aldo/keto reductase n=1 Tax=Pseudogemmobacter bohemicus TaxID=2250708 RepID=UPI0018E53A04|nr:aldo/keto reductase [Pseudogemmobacter bohemicus]
MIDTVMEIAADPGASPDQAALAWAGSHGALPMIGTRSLMQLSPNTGALVLELTPALIVRLDEVSGSPITPARQAAEPRKAAAPGL